jgi:hypothetical protein
MFNVISAVVLSAMGIAALLFAATILGTLLGGVAGLIVGAVFPYVIASLNTVLGLSLTGFEMGAVLGFVGGFLRSTTTVNKD